MITVEAGQTLLDVALQRLGSAEAIFELARINGLSVTDTVAPGTTLLLPDFVEPVEAGSTSVSTPLLFPTEAIVKQGQSLYDIAVQHCGDATAGAAIAKLNGLSPSAELKPGTWLQLPAIVEPGIVTFFTTGGYVPATGTIKPPAPGEEVQQGIGYWRIEKEFKVS